MVMGGAGYWVVLGGIGWCWAMYWVVVGTGGGSFYLDMVTRGYMQEAA